MKLIPIIKETIRPNPDYGKQMEMVPGKTHVTFIIENGNAPPNLKEGIDYIVTSWETNGHLITKEECQLIRPVESEALKGYNIEVNQDVKTILFGIQSKYLYDHDLTTELRCLSCGKTSAIKDIENYSYDNKGRLIDVCPHCDDVDSFEPYEFESLNHSAK